MVVMYTFNLSTLAEEGGSLSSRTARVIQRNPDLTSPPPTQETTKQNKKAIKINI
jgi:lysozyme family protein